MEQNCRSARPETFSILSMAQWIGIGLAGVNRARRAPAHVHKKLRERWPFRKRKESPAPREDTQQRDDGDTP